MVIDSDDDSAVEASLPPNEDGDCDDETVILTIGDRFETPL